jgi:hypothetical protein
MSLKGKYVNKGFGHKYIYMYIYLHKGIVSVYNYRNASPRFCLKIGENRRIPKVII